MRRSAGCLRLGCLLSVRRYVLVLLLYVLLLFFSISLLSFLPMSAFLCCVDVALSSCASRMVRCSVGASVRGEFGARGPGGESGRGRGAVFASSLSCCSSLVPRWRCWLVWFLVLSVGGFSLLTYLPRVFVGLAKRPQPPYVTREVPH